jgi:hypothetical protein
MFPEYLKEKFNQVYATGPVQRDRNFRLNVLTYEMGDLVKSRVYEEIYGSDSSEMRRAFKAEGKKAVSDALIQLLMLADVECYDYDELLKIGLEGLDEFLERKKSATK